MNSFMGFGELSY